ncbi:MAG: type I restriction enzyme HsdR N-terminal domain-containing protein [Bacteroidales bacterium]|nr:type I restriction enzyme HsdR N-terminal domain-containing protein [Bacteroidales bacterium]HOY38493.1 type I restriction endonuclease [Bacteroidales bacterium]HQP03593.1 type I restriction endonuclease [Bacteroidales bacterium]
MDFKDSIKQLAERVVKLKNQIQTEEATKNAFIMPFIQILGYDVFNPIEVVPEYTADLGLKKGEKVDYAILKDNIPQILIECKWWGENLDVYNSQLFRYFHTSKAKFGMLTNGIQYRFYTDLIEPNKMDDKPFLEFDITSMKEQAINELKKFHKSYFDINTIFNSASELKYSNEIRTILTNEFNNPSANFVRYFVKQVYSGQATERIINQFTEIVKRSANQLISDIINERLKSALDKENAKEIEQAKIDADKKAEEANKVVTTDEEIEAFFIVKSILREKIDCSRIFYRDFQNFFSILLDDSIRQTICRFYFKEDKKSIGVFDENKKEIKHDINKLDDIYLYSDILHQHLVKIAN